MALSTAETEAARMEEIESMVLGPFTTLDDGRIDCFIQHPVYGLVPFTADPDDIVEHGRMIHAIALVKGAS